MSVYLSFGSNVGDRLHNLRAAIDALRAEPGVTVLRESRVYETAPVGDTDQGPFLNMALAVETTLAPLDLLDRVQAIERALGRVPTRRWGPRVIDIDIVLWGELAMSTARLTIPHSEFRNRAFVLIPLREIAPRAIDPVSRRSIRDLASSVSVRTGVSLFQTPNPKPQTLNPIPNTHRR